jgi:hypothetical protein
LGEYPELTKRGIPITGTEIYGGAYCNGRGPCFIAGTKDERIRAFDRKTGKSSLGIPITCRRICNSMYLYGRWNTIYSDCGRRS